MGTCKRELSSVLLRKYIVSPKYMYWECRWRGYSEMADQAKTPLKIVQSCSNFTGYSIYSSEWNCIGLRTSRAILRISVSGGGAGLPPPTPHPPQSWGCQIYHNLLYLKPLFNFLHVLKINKDILSTFRALHLRTEIIEFEYCCKMVKIRCKSAKTSTKYWSIILKFGQKINWRILYLIA